MSLKNQLINYLLLHKDAGVNLLFLEEKLNINKKNRRIVLENTEKVRIKEEKLSENNLILSENISKVGLNSIKTENNFIKIEEKPIFKVEDQIAISELVIKDENLYNFAGINDLLSLKNHISGCRNCILGATRSNLVFGEGSSTADIMIIGEAPGAEEDEQGFPFVGRAGKLLTDILKAIDFDRKEVYISNICKCRPPGNRKPLAEEIISCEKYLHYQIELIKPQFILALGLTAAEALFKKVYKMGDIRGKVLDYMGIKTLITYHPAALLRNPNWKRPVWEDVRLLRSLYDNYLAVK